MDIGRAVAAGRGRPDPGVPREENGAAMRWLANYGLSLSGADCALAGPEERDSSCPFARLVQPPQAPTRSPT